MSSLNNLKNTTRPRKQYRRVGRGQGSGLGKTCGRGQKGAGARSGYKRRYGYEGGQMRMFMKLPQRGFSNAMFSRKMHTVNLTDLDTCFNDGDEVTIETLADFGFIRGRTYGVKLLSDGKLTKKLKIEVDAISESARAKVLESGSELIVLE